MNQSISSDPDTLQIRKTALHWTEAVARGDIVQLGQLMADDIVVIHGDGHIVSGRDRVLEDFARSFRTIRIRQILEPQEIVVAGDWAFDRSKVITVVSPVDRSDPKEYRSHTITILRKEGTEGWRVARSIGVVESDR